MSVPTFRRNIASMFTVELVISARNFGNNVSVKIIPPSSRSESSHVSPEHGGCMFVSKVCRNVGTTVVGTTVVGTTVVGTTVVGTTVVGTTVVGTTVVGTTAMGHVP
jgi:hypothetical protein